MGSYHRAPGPHRPRRYVPRAGGKFTGQWRGLLCVVKYRGPFLPPAPAEWFERGPLGYTVPYLPSKGSGMPKPFAEGQGQSAPMKGADKGALAKTYPELWSWLCDATYLDGAVMGQTMLQLRRQGCMVMASLKIEDQAGLKIEAVDVSPERALAALEALLSAPMPAWQKDRYPLGGAKPTVKKK